jgi:CBS domain-containing protein
MRIADVLRSKGHEVVTIGPDEQVRRLLELLVEHRVGAVVVSASEGVVNGIVNERDIVLALQRNGAKILDEPVSRIMTSEVLTIIPTDKVDEIMLQMTDHRVRHLPVIQDGRMIGIVSIGDLVNQCISELRVERDQLTAYITS